MNTIGHGLFIKNLMQSARLTQRLLIAYAIFLLALFSINDLRGADSGIGQKAEDVAHQTSTAVQNAETATVDTAKSLWQRIDSARLKNRTPDQIVAWVIMGVLVGAVAGMMTSLKPGGAGYVGRLALGLIGAFIGGIIAQVGNFNFGWGPVLIRYEELFFSLVGAIFIVVLAKFIRSRTTKKPANH